MGLFLNVNFSRKLFNYVTAATYDALGLLAASTCDPDCELRRNSQHLQLQNAIHPPEQQQQQETPK